MRGSRYTRSFLAASTSDGSTNVNVRMFVPGLKSSEDPATGSAAAGMGLVLRERGLLGEGGTYEITQGVDMGRPSRLVGRIEGEVIEVSGQVHPIARGVIQVPGQKP